MSSSRARTPGDHPRSRGVYFFATRMVSPRLGSSPLARGLLFGEPRSRVYRRIIPARAGFTPATHPESGQRQDHPRSRGVYIRTLKRSARMFGSSPLARGLPVGQRLPKLVNRIIPARAGFTGGRVFRGDGVSDHPRSRGVYHVGGGCGVVESGSSPLARGLPAR